MESQNKQEFLKNILDELQSLQEEASQLGRRKSKKPPLFQQRREENFIERLFSRYETNPEHFMVNLSHLME